MYRIHEQERFHVGVLVEHRRNEPVLRRSIGAIADGIVTHRDASMVAIARRNARLVFAVTDTRTPARRQADTTLPT